MYITFARYIPGDFVVLRLSFVKLLQHGKPETPLETPHHALLSLSLLIGTRYPILTLLTLT